MKNRSFVDVALETISKSDVSRLEFALSELASEGVLLSVKIDQESAQFSVGAATEQNILIAAAQLRHRFQIPVRLGPLQASYRETLTKEATSDFSHKRVVHGQGQFARLKLHMSLIEMGEDCTFKIDSSKFASKENYARGAERGVRSVLLKGPFAGFPATGFEVSVDDAAWHDEDSSELAFEIAARAALREGMIAGHVALVEPIMEAEIETNDEIPAALRYELNLRRAWMVGQRENSLNAVFMIPMASSFGLQEKINRVLRGRIAIALRFSHYSIVSTDKPPPPSAAMFAG